MTTAIAQLSDIPMWIDGASATAATNRWIEVVDPATSEPIARVPEGGPEDVDRAVMAARRAFAEGSRSRTLPAARAAVLLRIADLMEVHGAELAELEARNTGKTLRMARDFDLAGSIDNVRFFAGAARNLEGKAAGEYMPGITSLLRREPIGVVGSVAPWNYPLQMAVWKILPAIAAGNTIVLKPASLTPLTVIRARAHRARRRPVRRSHGPRTAHQPQPARTGGGVRRTCGGSGRDHLDGRRSTCRPGTRGRRVLPANGDRGRPPGR